MNFEIYRILNLKYYEINKDNESFNYKLNIKVY